MKTPRLSLSLASLVCVVAGLASAGAVDYAKDVLPIMKAHCWNCHSNEKDVKGNLALDDFDEVRDYQIGPYNIIDTTLDDLRSTASGSIEFLRDKTRQPRIGGVIKSGSLQELLESETAIDTVTMKFNFNIPIPLNNIDITIAV